VPEEDQPKAWVGRAQAPPPRRDWPTAEQPVVPSHYASPQVVYVERRRRGPLFAVGVLAALVAVGASIALLASPALRGVIGMGPGPSVTTPTPTPSPTPPPPPGVGDVVQDGAIEFVVIEVSCGHETVGQGIFTARARGQYCIVDVGLRNVGEVPALVRDVHQYVQATDGSRHAADSWATGLASGGAQLWLNLVVPGQSVRGSLAFDLPDGTTVATVELHDAENSAGAVVTV
jgi:hypothetical protein